MTMDLGKAESPWSATAAPAHQGVVKRDGGYDVAVVGAGVFGATTALVLARAGQSVVLLDAGDPVAASTTVMSTSKASIGHGAVPADIERRAGREAAVTYLRMHAWGLEQLQELAAAVAPESIRAAPQLVYAADEKRAADVAAGADLLDAAGFTLADVPALPWATGPGYALPDQFMLHPGSYLAGVIAAAAHAGADLVFGTRVTGLSGSEPVEVTLEDGEPVRAGRVVVATHYPFLLRGLPFARLSVGRHHGVQVTTNEPVPSSMTHELSDGGTVSTRRHTPANARRWIVVGPGYPTGTGPIAEGAGRDHWEHLVRWADERVGVKSVDRHWAAQDPSSPDLLPMVGQVSPLRSDVVYAAGFGGWGMTGGTVAAHLVKDRLLDTSDTPQQWRDAWDSLRVGSVKAALHTASAQAKVGLRLTRGLTHGVRADVDRIAPGSGAVVRDGLHQVAVYRDPAGALHEVSATCTHLGCTVAFNAAELSWDCPCHGSRFGVDGQVLDGPATRPLPPRSTT